MLYQYFFVLNRYFLFIHCHKQGMRLVMEKAAVYLRISKEDLDREGDTRASCRTAECFGIDGS